MKIGDEVYVHGYIDEIRNDVVIIHNSGGYFGTVPSEIKIKTRPQTDYDKGLKLFADILFDKEKSEQFLKECKAIGIEP